MKNSNRFVIASLGMMAIAIAFAGEARGALSSNLSGYEFFPGSACTVAGQPAKCNVEFGGWTEGSGQAATGWTAFPGDGEGLWNVNLSYTGTPEFGGEVTLVSGSYSVLFKTGRTVSGTVTGGTVVWPANAGASSSCGAGVAVVTVCLSGGASSFEGCLHDLPAGSAIPPEIWGTLLRPQVSNMQVQPVMPVYSPLAGETINQYGLGSLADEHSTIFPPGTFPQHPNDYLFFVATKTSLNGDHTQNTGDTSGLVVLTSSGPDASGQWTLDYASDYGLYQPTNPLGQQNGQVFIAPMDRESCPASYEDTTFDLNYANPGQVVIDPTNPFNTGPGNLLMIYEGTNKCLGALSTNSTKPTGSFYASIGIATSNDYGHTWPSYAPNSFDPSFGFTPLPQQNLSYGPNIPWTSFGVGGPVCIDINNVCTPPPHSPLYGRYGVLSPPVSLPSAALEAPLSAPIGEQEPSAFVDPTLKGTYLYVVYDPSDGEISVARALLGGTHKLSFTKWFGSSVSYGDTSSGSFQPSSYNGVPNNGSGVESPIFPMQAGAAPGSASYQSCQADTQLQEMGSISYVDETNQYLMTFVCSSPTDPENALSTVPGCTPPLCGAAWFYSTLDGTQYDLSRQDKWSTPQEITHSWVPFDSSYACNYSSAWYPSFMSPDVLSAHLSTNGGYVFSMQGCPGAGDPNLRRYSSRALVIATQ